MTVEISNSEASAPTGLRRRWARSERWREIRRRRARALEWLRDDLSMLSVWTPVFIGIGIGVYFSLKSEPAFAVGATALALCAVVVAALPKNRSVWTVALLAIFGFVAADWRTERVQTPILDRDIGIRAIDGQVYAVERSADRERLIIDVQSIAGLNRASTPKRVRITWRGDHSVVSAGDHITVRAGLSPPPPPAAPGNFDFGRQLYFQSIGAVGFAVTTPVSTGPANDNSLRTRIENIRSGLTNKIITAAPGQGGAIVAAVVTGKREAISEESRAALRDAGLAHLLAISGLHMGLATGLVFFTVRAALAAIEPIAIRFPIKKFAAAAAFFPG